MAVALAPMAGSAASMNPAAVALAQPGLYSLYGLSVRSDVPLPAAAPIRDPLAQPDWIISRAGSQRAAPEQDGLVVSEIRCHAPCHGGRVVTRVSRGPRGTWMWNDDIATFHIPPEARRVDVYAASNADEGVIGILLIGQVAVSVLHQLGYPALHASAATLPSRDGAVAFLGPKGQGKSTMAASFLRWGGALLTDDVLPLRFDQPGASGGEILGAPGLPLMKVWRETAECTLSIADDLPNVSSWVDKKLLTLSGRYAYATYPVPLRVVYVLDRYDPSLLGDTRVDIRPITARAGVATLLAQTSYSDFLRPAEIARFLPLYARFVAEVPLRILTYPNGFDYQELVHARILDDVRAAGHGGATA